MQRYLIVLSPGLFALSATEKPHFTLISRPERTEPVFSFIIVALRTPDGDRGEGSDFISIINNNNFFLGTFIGLLHQSTGRFFFCPPATGADKRTALILEHSPAFLTEHHVLIKSESILDY